MKLHFHGADYDRPSLKLPATDEQMGGRYRGLQVNIHHHSVSKRQNHQDRKMTYRGVTYTDS